MKATLQYEIINYQQQGFSHSFCGVASSIRIGSPCFFILIVLILFLSGCKTQNSMFDTGLKGKRKLNNQDRVVGFNLLLEKHRHNQIVDSYYIKEIEK